MKVKQVKEVTITSEEGATIILNRDAKAGDTVAKELVFMVSDSATVENDYGTQMVINASTLQVEEYTEGWAIIPCEGLDVLYFSTSAEEATLFYQILV